MTTAVLPIDVHILNDFRPGFADIFTQHCASEFEWNTNFSADVITDALRVFSLTAIPPSGIPTPDWVQRTLVTSPIVDKVMDTILLNTPLLMWLEDLFGCRMVHEPAYAHGNIDPIITNLRYEFTVNLMQTAGYAIDRAVIWPSRLPVGYQSCTCDNDTKDCTWRFTGSS